MGPLKVNDDIVSDPKDISNIFVQYFSSVFKSHKVDNKSKHQQCDEQMKSLTFTYDITLDALLKLNACDSLSSDSVHPQDLEAYVLFLIYPSL